MLRSCTHRPGYCEGEVSALACSGMLRQQSCAVVEVRGFITEEADNPCTLKTCSYLLGRQGASTPALAYVCRHYADTFFCKAGVPVERITELLAEDIGLAVLVEGFETGGIRKRAHSRKLRRQTDAIDVWESCLYLLEFLSKGIPVIIFVGISNFRDVKHVFVVDDRQRVKVFRYAVHFSLVGECVEQSRYYVFLFQNL